VLPFQKRLEQVGGTATTLWHTFNSLAQVSEGAVSEGAVSDVDVPGVSVE
jgi:hypothetical protein